MLWRAVLLAAESRMVDMIGTHPFPVFVHALVDGLFVEFALLSIRFVRHDSGTNSGLA